MLARIQILLPFTLTVPDKTSFPVYNLQKAGYNIRFLPPSRSDYPRGPFIPSEVGLNDHPAFLADVFTLDFQKAEFDRREGDFFDPPLALIQEAINHVLSRLRYVIQAPAIRPLDIKKTIWHLTYLTDEEKELEPKKGLIRQKRITGFNFSLMPTTPEVWSHAFNLPYDFRLPSWNTLLLDARDTLPETGPSIVLAFTALEVFISDLLESLASKSNLSPTLWSWIKNRGNRLKEPSITEQFGTLLEEFCGANLKSEKQLWESFMQLKEARNNFVHEGIATIGKNKEKLDIERALQLISNAEKIILFIRGYLPEEMKWPVFEHKFKFEASHNIGITGEDEKQAKTSENV